MKFINCSRFIGLVKESKMHFSLVLHLLGLLRLLTSLLCPVTVDTVVVVVEMAVKLLKRTVSGCLCSAEQ